jgi:YVTN family beta-propeller protein
MKRLAFVAAAGGILSCMDGLPSKTVPIDGLETTEIAPVSYDAVYVVNGEDATISVINAENNTVAGSIALKGMAYPHHVGLSPDRTQLAIAVPGYDMSMGEFGHAMHSSRPGHVVLLDALTGALVAAKKTDASNNNAVFAPGTDQLWTSQATTPGSTLILDAKTLELRESISVGTSPAETAMTADGTLAFVANSGSATVSVIDVPNRRLRATIKVGAGPVLAVPSPQGLVFVENEPDQTISVIDQATLAVKQTFSIGYKPGSVSVASNGELWITSPDRGVAELRDGNGTVVNTIPTGAGAHWVLFSQDGSRVYVSNEWANTVSVIDRATKAVTATIPVGAKPNGMVWRSK